MSASSPIQLDLTLPEGPDAAKVLGKRIERALRQARDQRMISGYSVIEVKRLMTPLPRITVLD